MTKSAEQGNKEAVKFLKNPEEESGLGGIIAGGLVFLTGLFLGS